MVKRESSVLAAAIGGILLPRHFSTLTRGGVVEVPNFLSSGQTNALRRDIKQLRDLGEFEASGLRNNSEQDGPIEAYGESDRLVRIITHDLGGDIMARTEFDDILESLRAELSSSLGLTLSCAEQYYSIYGPGSYLACHMDERHEDTKGDRGWESRSRRSVSWLVYLSEEDWEIPGGAGSGGNFRGYVRSECQTAARCGSHEGDLQVGWLARAEGDEPVFLDSWVQSKATPEVDSSVKGGDVLWRPLSQLYCTSFTGNRDAVSPAFSSDSESWPVPADGVGFTANELQAAFAAQLHVPLRGLFSATDSVFHRDDLDLEEDGKQPDDPWGSQRVVDVSPSGGKLVLFDSVAVPHEVLPVASGERFAVAGWFHERQQSFPEWFGT